MSKHTTSARAGAPRTRLPQQDATQASDQGHLDVEWWPTRAPRPYARNPRRARRGRGRQGGGEHHRVRLRRQLLGRRAQGHDRSPATPACWPPSASASSEVPVHVAGDLSPAQVKAYASPTTAAPRRAAGTSSCCRSRSGSSPTRLRHRRARLRRRRARRDHWPRRPRASPIPTRSPPLPAEPVTRPGDLWKLGEHRLLCGDATAADDVARLMDGRRAALMATDPPYLVDYDGGTHPPTWGATAARSAPRPREALGRLHRPRALGRLLRDFLAVALEHALSADAGRLPVVRHHARRGRPRRLATRSACWPTRC